jgi:hypothetical protein
MRGKGVIRLAPFCRPSIDVKQANVLWTSMFMAGPPFGKTAGTGASGRCFEPVELRAAEVSEMDLGKSAVPS